MKCHVGTAPWAVRPKEARLVKWTIGYLIVGNKRALLFDTGMGISDIKKVTGELTTLPIICVGTAAIGCLAERSSAALLD
jgi:hypothetical protein